MHQVWPPVLYTQDLHAGETILTSSSMSSYVCPGMYIFILV